MHIHSVVESEEVNCPRLSPFHLSRVRSPVNDSTWKYPLFSSKTYSPSESHLWFFLVSSSTTPPLFQTYQNTCTSLDMPWGFIPPIVLYSRAFVYNFFLCLEYSSLHLRERQAQGIFLISEKHPCLVSPSPPVTGLFMFISFLALSTVCIYSNLPFSFLQTGLLSVSCRNTNGRRAGTMAALFSTVSLQISTMARTQD